MPACIRTIRRSFVRIWIAVSAKNARNMSLSIACQKGNGEYIWVKTKVSVIQCDGDCVRVYADYHDVTAEKKVKEQLRQQYQEQIHQHYQLAGPDALILGHCNITKNQILEIVDHTDSDLLSLFGSERENFFTGLGTLIVDQEEPKRPFTPNI